MNDSGITRRAALTGAAAALPLLGVATTARAESPAGGWHGNFPPPDVNKMLREISAANIQRTIGNVTNVVLHNLSKDNFWFGVRAVDKDGNRSPVAFPRPTST